MRVSLSNGRSEFIDLWTLPYSDCVSIDGWHSPTVHDMIRFMNSQNLESVDVDVIVEYVERVFGKNKKWEKMMRAYWDKAKLFI